jgi:acylphosphatase
MGGAGGKQRSVRVRIRGRVQGVWYRAWTREEAVARGITGWVRNRSDGSVEALFMGPAAVVDDMIAACRRGPELARVATVDVNDDPGETLDGFEQRSNA